MANGKVCDPQKESNKFHIEKTQSTLFEVCKRLTNAAGISIFLLIIAAIITFGKLVGVSDGESDKDFLSLPFMNLTMKRHYVAEIFVVLTCASICRAFSLNKYERLIQFRLKQLMEGATWDTDTWALEYPSVFYLFYRIRKLSETGRVVTTTMCSFLFLAGFTVPLIILVFLGKNYGFTLTWNLAFGFSLFLLIVAGTIFLSTPGKNKCVKTLNRLNKKQIEIKADEK